MFGFVASYLAAKKAAAVAKRRYLKAMEEQMFPVGMRQADAQKAANTQIEDYREKLKKPDPDTSISEALKDFTETILTTEPVMHMNSPVYSHSRWETLVAETQDKMDQLAKLKGGEYAGDEDRLANFRRHGIALGLPMETVWAVYAGKHWDAIQQWIKDTRNGTARERLEPIGGRIDDLLVYLILLKAMLGERGVL